MTDKPTGETYREITKCYVTSRWNDSVTWFVEYQVWGVNGRDLGKWSVFVVSPDEAGARLKTYAKWVKRDQLNAKRRARAAKKEQADGADSKETARPGGA